jgi:hypothetical protein
VECEILLLRRLRIGKYVGQWLAENWSAGSIWKLAKQTNSKEAYINTFFLNYRSIK